MKNPIPLMSLVGTTFLSACAFHDLPIAIQPVGPSPSSSSGFSARGTLVVYSGWSVFNNYDTINHSGYTVYSGAGKLVKWVPNYLEGNISSEPPSQVSLPAGSYMVRAISEDYGRVTVPVVIKGGKTTFVYLDNASQPPYLQRNQTNVVKLPDGQVVGWVATAGMKQP